MSNKASKPYKFISSDMIQMLYAKMDEIEAAYKKSNKLLEQAETISNKTIQIDLEPFEKLVKEQKAELFELNKKNIEEMKAISSDLKEVLASGGVKLPLWLYFVTLGSLMLNLLAMIILFTERLS